MAEADNMNMSEFGHLFMNIIETSLGCNRNTKQNKREFS